MRAVLATLACVLLVGTSAQAAVPVSPPSGSSYTTTDVVTFTADAGDDPRDHVILFSPGAVFDPKRWFTFGNTTGEEKVDLGWLASKFDHLGNFTWTTCPQSADLTPLAAECAPAWGFAVTFRMPTMTRKQARFDARHVMGRKFRSYWRAGYNHRVVCSSRTRTRQRCKISMVVGDVLLYGRVTAYLSRDGEHPWVLHRYRARVTIYNEYCHLVNERPFKECRTIRRPSGLVYE